MINDNNREQEMMNIVLLGDWNVSGDIGLCDLGLCVEEATKYATIKGETWFFCKTHFREYLKLVREQRNISAGNFV
jgi:hypothetical protein